MVAWTRPESVSEGPLRGVRVLDAGTMIAGPFVASLLADYGAEVIKVERPVTGDAMRQWPPMKDGLSLWWKVTARGKLLVTLDLGKEPGRDVFLKLVADADVVVENYRPGTLERWRLGYPELRDANRGVVLCRVSGYGQTGPYCARPGYGTIAEAMTGIPSFTGFPDKPPGLPAFPTADTVAGTFGALGVLAALYERDHGDGAGQEIDVSLYEPLFRLAEAQVIAYDQLGLVKSRVGNRLEEDVPRNAYLTRDDRWVVLSAGSDRVFGRLAHAIDRPDLRDDPRFATQVARTVHVDELDGIVAEWIRLRSAGDVLNSFEHADVVAGPVLDIRDIFADAHYAARQSVVEVPDDDFETVRMPGAFPGFSRTPGRVRWAGGGIGRDNDLVFGDILGLSRDDIEALTAQGVI